MEDKVKVFHSDITRDECNKNNHLYELIQITPARPVLQKSPQNKPEPWEFTPNCDKHYVPRNRSKLKVKTVREIRSLLEKDVNIYLTDDLKNQEKFLLRKVRDGFSCDIKTKQIATKLLLADNPISRYAWEMINNINPENYLYPKQFILWNGKCIQINGSRGGNSKFICNHDLKNYQVRHMSKKSKLKKDIFKAKMVLLRNSLNVKFKPGPLGKKQFLDDSHHKYQMGEIELINLPTPALEISPAYGTVLEPPILGFINSLRGETGVITQTLAEFAVSVLGTICKQTCPTQLDQECCVTFHLNYKCGQNRLLMRRNAVESKCSNTEKNLSCTGNVSTATSHKITNTLNLNAYSDPEMENMADIRQVMHDMLNCVDISLMQDSMYYSVDEPRATVAGNCAELNGTIKDKPKRKYCELGKLDVTVIKLPEGSQNQYDKPCEKKYCEMGCICESLDSSFSIKQHCGVLDCMFGCKCETSKYNVIELLDRDYSEIVPGLMNLENQINSHLTKEEKKFHQTVIVSGDKSILLKSQNRKLKSSKLYEDFNKKINLKDAIQTKKALSVDVLKLNCDNVEPFCMVHNLYKCFCKCKFTECAISNTSEINQESGTNLLKSRSRKTEKIKTVSDSVISDCIDLCLDTDSDNLNSSSCARTTCYRGRKYSDEYYNMTHKRISGMEINDHVLRKKMFKLINGRDEDASESNKSGDGLQNHNCPKSRNTPNVNLQALNDDSSNKSLSKSEDTNDPFTNISVKHSLKYWLETSYKIYKERREQGILKNCLDAPKKGKAALQSWDFILSRYRDRKNLFFVSSGEPYRTFLAIDGEHPIFANCTNIDDIRFADLHKYPQVIRNLVTNSTDSENSFCILRGWDHCWELIGSAVKVIERAPDTSVGSKETLDSDTLMTEDNLLDNVSNDWIDVASDDSTSIPAKKLCTSAEADINNIEKSKWFVMTVENDFTEIQFYKKGFFVTYQGIQRSISLARISGKTVRLSSQACSDGNSSQQFGIYAIPCLSECCVFIGPYEENEPLGIEVVKTFVDHKKQNKTRGLWITTSKVDNMKILDHPLSFIPSISNDDMVTLESGDNTKQPLIPNGKNKDAPNEIKIAPKISKVVKPIKIRRTNGFFHFSPRNIRNLSPNDTSLLVNKATNLNKSPIETENLLSLLQKPTTLTQQLLNTKSKLNINSKESNQSSSTAFLKPVAEIAPQISNSEICNINAPVAYVRPVAEIAPQIKITSVYSERKKSKPTSMLILKPEQINRKIFVNTPVDDMAPDIEKFLETSTICIAPPDEVLVISDGEDETMSCVDVWVQCKNVKSFGCIRGRTKDKDMLSFEFPGFQYSEFYTQAEAFDKINQVLARKIYTPSGFTLKWELIADRSRKREILTEQCLQDKQYLITRLLKNGRPNKTTKKETVNSTRTHVRTDHDRVTRRSSSVSCRSTDASLTSANKTDLMEKLEETSKKLENQRALLWNTAIMKRDELISSLNALKSVDANMSEQLNDIIVMNEPTTDE